MAAHILKLAQHEDDKEIDFELKYQASLTINQRFEMMFAKTREIRNLLRKNGKRKATGIIKRGAR